MDMESTIRYIEKIERAIESFILFRERKDADIHLAKLCSSFIFNGIRKQDIHCYEAYKGTLNLDECKNTRMRDLLLFACRGNQVDLVKEIYERLSPRHYSIFSGQEEVSAICLNGSDELFDFYELKDRVDVRRYAQVLDVIRGKSIYILEQIYDHHDDYDWSEAVSLSCDVDNIQAIRFLANKGFPPKSEDLCRILTTHKKINDTAYFLIDNFELSADESINLFIDRDNIVSFRYLCEKQCIEITDFLFLLTAKQNAIQCAIYLIEKGVDVSLAYYSNQRFNPSIQSLITYAFNNQTEDYKKIQHVLRNSSDSQDLWTITNERAEWLRGFPMSDPMLTTFHHIFTKLDSSKLPKDLVFDEKTPKYFLNLLYERWIPLLLKFLNQPSNSVHLYNHTIHPRLKTKLDRMPEVIAFSKKLVMGKLFVLVRTSDDIEPFFNQIQFVGKYSRLIRVLVDSDFL